MTKHYRITKQENAINFHNYIDGLIQYYGYPKIDLGATSPPFNIGIRYAGYHDDIPPQEWMDTIIHSIFPSDKIANDGALFYLNLKPDNDNLAASLSQINFIVSEIDRLSEWKLIQIITWVMPNKQQKNQFVEQKRFTTYTENLYLFAKGNYRVRQDLIGEELSKAYLNDKRYQEVIERYKEKFGRAYRDVGDIWVIPHLKYNKHLKRLNPAEYPPQLVEWMIKTHPEYGKKRLTVYDPFMGGGTTLYVAHHLDENYYGGDISESAVNTTRRVLTMDFEDWRKRR